MSIKNKNKDYFIIIGSDHGGYDMKEIIKLHLKSNNINFEDIGTYTKESCDYPDIAKKVCNKLINKNKITKSLGILICGSGIGISIAANKISGIRCALCHDNYTAKMSRKHNNANVLAIGGRTTGIEIVKDMIDTFINEEFEGGRHTRRINKLE